MIKYKKLSDYFVIRNFAKEYTNFKSNSNRSYVSGEGLAPTCMVKAYSRLILVDGLVSEVGGSLLRLRW